MSTLFVHAGYPKTATSTFQKHVFSSHPEIDYLGKFIPGYRYRDERLFSEVEELMTSDSCRYKGVETLRRIIEEHRARCERKALLISSESFLHVTATDLGLVAERVKAAFWPCKIIVTIRNQLDMIRSFYGMHGRFGQYLFLMKSESEKLRIPISLEQWLSYSFRAPAKGFPAILHYRDVLRRYREVFGRENVGVFLFEEFVADRSAYIHRLSQFLGVDAEAMLALAEGKHELSNLTRGELAYFRLRSWLGSGFRFDPATMDRGELNIAFAGSRQRAGVSLDLAWERRLKELYREGNRALQEQDGLPLELYGYPV
jgi:hypothetical protein